MRLAAADILIDLATRQRTDTCCSRSDEDILASISWGGDDALACDRKGGGVEIHDFATEKTIELDAGAPRWDDTGRFLLLGSAPSKEGWAVYERASGALIDPPSGTQPKLELDRPDWIGVGNLVRIQEGDARTAPTRLWDAKTRSIVGPVEDGEVRLRSTSPSRAFVLELRGDAVDDSVPPPPSEAYLVNALTGARYHLASGITRLDSATDALRLFSPDSTKVAVPLTKGGVMLFDTATASSLGVLTARGCETPLQVAWSPKGDIVAVGSDSSHVCVFDTKTLKVRRSWAVPRPSTIEGTPTPDVDMLVFFAGGRGLAAGNFTGEGYAVTLWTPMGKQLGPLQFAAGSTGGARVTTRGDALIDSARIDTGLAIHEGDSWSQIADITPEGRFLRGFPESAGGNLLETVDVPLPTFENGEGATFASISPDGEKVFGYVKDEPRVWDLTTGKLLFP